MDDRDRLEQLTARYHAALHAVQTGIAYTMEYDPSGTSPKHLRVGIDSVHISQAAIMRVLIAKGICTEIEFMEALVVETEAEQARYQAELSQRFGRKITLG